MARAQVVVIPESVGPDPGAVSWPRLYFQSAGKEAFEGSEQKRDVVRRRSEPDPILTTSQGGQRNHRETIN